MKMSTFAGWLGVMIGFISVATAQDSVADAGSEKPADLAQIEAMSAAIEQWLEDTEFACRYSTVLGRAVSREDALNGIVDEKEGVKRATGVFNKTKGKVRQSIDFKDDIRTVSEIGDGTEVVNMDADEISADSGVMLRYNPKLTPEDNEGVANFLPKDVPAGLSKIKIGRFDAGIMTKRRISPLAIDGNEVGSYLQSTSGTAAKTSVLSSDDKEVVIRVQFLSGSYETTKDVTFSLVHSRPVVSRIHTVMKSDTGEEYEADSHASEFIEVPGGPVARLVRSASFSASKGKPRNEALPWLVLEWRSDDLGSRSVERSDFLVAIGPNTRVRGVGVTSKVMTDGKLDIDKVAKSELDIFFAEDEQIALAQAELNAAANGAWWRNSLLFVNLGILGVVCMWALSRFARRKQQ